jgi:soluble lytic murein transglycosylase-like protein
MGLLTIFTAVTLQLNLPPNLLSSICWIESRHKVNAVHKDDGGESSLGVCQIKYSTAKWLGFKGKQKELMNPKINIYYAGLYLKYNLKRYNNISRAVVAYNRGNAKNLLKTKYSMAVMRVYERNK